MLLDTDNQPKPLQYSASFTMRLMRVGITIESTQYAFTPRGLCIHATSCLCSISFAASYFLRAQLSDEPAPGLFQFR